MVPRERDKNALRSDVCPKIILTVQWGVTWAGNGTEPICITFQRETILKVAYWAPQQKIPFGQIVHMGKVSPIGPYSASSDYSLSTVLHGTILRGTTLHGLFTRKSGPLTVWRR